MSSSSSRKKEELALCYYKTASSKDKSGWIFLSDVTNVKEQLIHDHNGSSSTSTSTTSTNTTTTTSTNITRWIHVVHPKRIFKLRGIDHRDHILWWKTLCQVCDIDVKEVEVGNSQGKDDDYHTNGNYNDDINDDINGNINGNLDQRSGIKVLEPAKATYEKEGSLSYDPSNTMNHTPIKDDKHHEVEMNFMRELTGGQTKRKQSTNANENNNDNKHDDDDEHHNNNDDEHVPKLYYENYHFHNEELVEGITFDKEKNGTKGLFSPSYHEIITERGIEQHTVLSPPLVKLDISSPLRNNEDTRKVSRRIDLLKRPTGNDDSTEQNVPPATDTTNNNNNNNIIISTSTSSTRIGEREKDEEENDLKPLDQNNIIFQSLNRNDVDKDMGMKSTPSPSLPSHRDHRLNQNPNEYNKVYDAYNETIHTRLGRAILGSNLNNSSNEEQNDIANNDEKNDNPHNHTSAVMSNNDIVTMVEEISFEDEDTEQSFVTTKSKLDNIETESINDYNYEDKEIHVSHHHQLQLGDISFENDVLSINHDNIQDLKADNGTGSSNIDHYTNEHCDDDHFFSPDKDFVINNWDEEKSTYVEHDGSSVKKTQELNQVEHSFDTDCSFRPDKDFINEDWDS